MATGTLARPGTAAGPCAEPCEHRDCKATRDMAAAACGLCGEPIGYDTRFYQIPYYGIGYVHALCLEDEKDEARLRLEPKA